MSSYVLVVLLVLSASLQFVPRVWGIRHRASHPPKPKWAGVIGERMTRDKMLSNWRSRQAANFWEESGQFEGDIMLEGLGRTGLINPSQRWPGGLIPYYIDDGHFDKNQKEEIKSVIEEYHTLTCIKFRPYRKSDSDFIVLRSNKPGCWSYVGHKGGGQVINLQSGCLRRGTIAHELLHAIGFKHQQSATNRDDYVSIKWENILDDQKENFKKQPSDKITDFGVGYDYDSVMHYSRDAFSKNKLDTIVPHDPDAEIGQRIGLSEKDILKINRMYKCDKERGGGVDLLS